MSAPHQSSETECIFRATPTDKPDTSHNGFPQQTDVFAVLALASGDVQSFTVMSSRPSLRGLWEFLHGARWGFSIFADNAVIEGLYSLRCDAATCGIYRASNTLAEEESRLR